MEYKRILAVGDIHGMYDKLTALMEQVHFNPADDLLVFLGDYIDRGPQSLECLDYVMSLYKQYPEQVIPLLGNHEAMCTTYYRFEGRKLDSMMDDVDFQMVRVWLDNGGNETHKQFKKLKKPELQKRLRWMRMLSNHYQVGNYYFCHAGIQPYILLEKQRESDLLWMRAGFFEQYDGRYGTIVAGHNPVQNLSKKYWTEDKEPVVPMFLDNKIIMCDTGSFMENGKLSCVDVLTKQYWQA